MTRIQHIDDGDVDRSGAVGARYAELTLEELVGLQGTAMGSRIAERAVAAELQRRQAAAITELAVEIRQSSVSTSAQARAMLWLTAALVLAAIVQAVATIVQSWSTLSNGGTIVVPTG